jgi:hypothetical protein
VLAPAGYWPRAFRRRGRSTGPSNINTAHTECVARKVEAGKGEQSRRALWVICGPVHRSSVTGTEAVVTGRGSRGRYWRSSKLLTLVEYEVYSPRVNQFDALTPDAASATGAPDHHPDRPVQRGCSLGPTRRGSERMLRPSRLVRSVGGLEGIHDCLGDAAAVGDLVAVLPGPRPDRRGLLAVERLGPWPRACGHLLRAAAARGR